MTTHELKILPEYFEAVSSGLKDFEIRKNDRDYKVGDILVLKEWNKGMFTGKEVTRKVKYIYCGKGTYGIFELYCILGLEHISNDDSDKETTIKTSGMYRTICPVCHANADHYFVGVGVYECSNCGKSWYEDEIREVVK